MRVRESVFENCKMVRDNLNSCAKNFTCARNYLFILIYFFNWCAYYYRLRTGVLHVHVCVCTHMYVMYV